jgi:hypothetical protein
MHRLRLQELQEQEAALQDGDRLAFLLVLAKPQVKRVSQESLVTATHIHSAVVTVRSASLRCWVGQIRVLNKHQVHIVSPTTECVVGKKRM